MLEKIFESEVVHKMRITFVVLNTNKPARRLLVLALTFVVAVALIGTVILGNVDLSGDMPQKNVHAYMNYSAPVIFTAIAPADPENQIVFTAIVRDDAREPGGQGTIVFTDIHSEPILGQDTAGPAEEIPAIRFYPLHGHWDQAVSDTFIFLPGIPLSEELQRFTYYKSMEIGFNYRLALALMWQESNFNAGAVNHNTNGTQDSGIMQINDVNRSWLYEEMNIYNLFDPYQNITAGMEILRRLNDQYGERLAIMAYQLGEAGMRRQVEQGITTSRHVERVFYRYDRLLEMFAALDDV